MTVPALAFANVSKAYRDAVAGSRHALVDVSFDLAPGRIVAVVGRSGSGKSTLLHLAAGIDTPTTGEVSIHGRLLGRLSEGERTHLRRTDVGLVFQFFHLLPHLSVRDNVALPGLIAGTPTVELHHRAAALLHRVDLGDRAADRVTELSGGEAQRVAICRALLQRPRVLLADEPTGNLDDANGQIVLDLMIELAREDGATLVYVTHSGEIAAAADEVWEIHSGRLQRP